MNSVRDYNFLSDFLKTTRNHGKFLNTLSFLEYLGAKKLAASIDVTKMNSQNLGHAFEEFKHAFMLKKLAKKVSGCDFSYGPADVFCYDACAQYMNQIDEYSYSIAGEHDAFTLATYIIELRAVNFYEFYHEHLSPLGLSLKPLLSEEVHHLEQTTLELSTRYSKAELEKAKAFEYQCFSTLMMRLGEEAALCRAKSV
jgi:hypothetical protein